jgi:hypothetical protein
VVTTDRSDERALVPEYSRGVHLEEMSELSKAGRSRNAHRVAVGRGGVGKEVWNGNYGSKKKTQMPHSSRQEFLLYIVVRGHGSLCGQCHGR